MSIRSYKRIIKQRVQEHIKEAIQALKKEGVDLQNSSLVNQFLRALWEQMIAAILIVDFHRWDWFYLWGTLEEQEKEVFGSKIYDFANFVQKVIKGAFQS